MNPQQTEKKPASAPGSAAIAPWYSGVTSYQWLVLLIASLGWVFDAFEGQIFVASMNEAMPSLLPAGTSQGTIEFYNKLALGAFLVGGALGGVAFGMLSDRIGRTKTMVYTILMYCGFTCITAFATSWWMMVLLRFLVAMGVGGEWAVASAMVAEVFPQRARARSLGIFHATSVLGTFLAVAAGAFIVGNPKFGWRWGFGIGAVPALLTLWIRWRLHEPDQWVHARKAAMQDPAKRVGRITELFVQGLRRKTVVGVLLAAIGLATFWGVHVYGKDLMRRAATKYYSQMDKTPAATSNIAASSQKADYTSTIKKWEMLGMLLVTTGGGLGLLAFGPISERIGRRGAFLFFNIGGLVSGLLLFQVFANTSITNLCVALPVFGFLTLGMHAGYAIYFPELFPTRLRGTGGGFCFNFGRILAAPILFISGWMQKDWGFSLESSASILSLLFLFGCVVLLFAPETRGLELPE